MPAPAPPTTPAGELIRQGRKAAGWSQTELGRRLRTLTGDFGSQTVVSELESGGFVPSDPMKVVLDRLLGLDGALLDAYYRQAEESVRSLFDRAANLGFSKPGNPGLLSRLTLAPFPTIPTPTRPLAAA